MAKIVLTDCSVLVDSVDLSDHASKVTITTGRNQVDLTSFGDTNTEYGLGLGDASIQIDLFQDYASSSIDAVLWNIYTGGTFVPVTVKPTSGFASATNPAYILQEGLLAEYTPVDGQVGVASTLTVKFINSAVTGITRSLTGLPPVLDAGAPAGSPLTLDGGSPTGAASGTIDGGSP